MPRDGPVVYISADTCFVHTAIKHKARGKLDATVQPKRCVHLGTKAKKSVLSCSHLRNLLSKNSNEWDSVIVFTVRCVHTSGVVTVLLIRGSLLKNVIARHSMDFISHATDEPLVTVDVCFL